MTGVPAVSATIRSDAREGSTNTHTDRFIIMENGGTVVKMTCSVGVAVAVGVADGDGELVAVGVAVAVHVGVIVVVGDEVCVGLGVAVMVGVGVASPKATGSSASVNWR